MSQLYVLAFEGFLALLLIIAIGYCIRLDSKLKQLRNGNMRMLGAARELQSSVQHAEQAVAMLRRSADAAGHDLQAKIDEARAMTAAAQAAAQYVREEPSREPAAPRGSDFSLRRRSL